MEVVWGLGVVGKEGAARQRPYDGMAAAGWRTACMVPSGCIVAVVQRGSNSTR
jgi:hypothetical protein